MTTMLIIMRSGPFTGRQICAKNGLQVCIIEAGEVGGTCLNCGCIPTKCFAMTRT